MAADVATLCTVEAVGPERAEAIAGFFATPTQRALIARLRAAGVQMPERAVTGPTQGPFTGMTLVVTGTLSEPRDAIEAAIKQAGGKVSSSVSKKTSAVVCGEAAGSKLEKARTLGVPVWTEADLRARLAGTEAAA